MFTCSEIELNLIKFLNLYLITCDSKERELAEKLLEKLEEKDREED